MPDTTCFGSLQVCMTRVAALASNGAPLPGPDNGYVTDALIHMDLNVELAKDVDLEKENGCGAICQSYFRKGAIKRASLVGSFCELDIQLGNLMLGGTLAKKAGPSGAPFGWSAPLSTDPAPDGVCLELWTKAWDGTEPATPSSVGGAAANFHWVFPRAQFSLDKMTLQNDFLEFAMTGFSNENHSMPHHGPFHDWDGDWAAAGGAQSCFNFYIEDEADMPEANCAFIEVPAVTS